jgi:hypothetical protein
VVNKYSEDVIASVLRVEAIRSSKTLIASYKTMGITTQNRIIDCFIQVNEAVLTAEQEVKHRSPRGIDCYIKKF